MSALAPDRLGSRDEANARELTLHVSHGHACFEGHFPSDPLVPGVVQLHWAVCELERWLARGVVVEAFEALKFRRPLRPGATFVLRVSRGSSPRAFAFELGDADGQISSGRLRVRP